MTPTRTEAVQLRLTLDRGLAEAHETALETILDGKVPRCQAGDTLKVEYQFSIAYFGNVVAKLKAINEMIASGVATDGSIEELIHGRSLIREVLSQFDRLIAREARK